MDAEASLEAAAPAALERAPEPVCFLQMEPGAVERILEAGGAREHHQARAGLRELRLVERRTDRPMSLAKSPAPKATRLTRQGTGL